MTNERPYILSDFDDRHPSTKHVLQYFTDAHLPEHLQLISRPFATLAFGLTSETEDGPELTAGLRKLLEAKDCFVRAMVTQTNTKP